MAKRLGRDVASEIIDHQAWKPNRNPLDIGNDHYEFDESFKHWKDGDDPLSIHSVPDLIQYLEKNPKAQIDAKVFGVRNREAQLFNLKREGFLKAARSRKTLREGIDNFSTDASDNTRAGSGLGGEIGNDFTSLIGGPFSKQLYYTDYVKMHQAAFFAFHHDPFGRRIVNLTKHFTLGKGFRVDCDDKAALAFWHAFVEANDLMTMFDHMALELSTYGELMPYWLPDGATKITYGIPVNEIPKGLIPRVRLLDPSTIWEIVTYPEDITRVIGYQQVFPTQWQMYTYGKVPTTKFIYQQLPGTSVQHFKINEMSNEKRGRSDLFPVLSYMKRLRDLVNYGLVGEMKNAAWCMDTTVEGGKADIAAYVSSQRRLGTIPAAGSEFVHTAKIKREYRSNSGSGSHVSGVFDWAFSMLAVGSGIPVSYFGSTHTSGSTRASAVVGTEPVAKLFEDRQNTYQKIILSISRRLFDRYGLNNAQLEVTFPEIITQDRSAKLKDLALAESQGWIDKRHAATIAAKELGITDFDFDTDAGETTQDAGGGQDGQPLSSNGGLSGDERVAAKKAGTGKP